MAARRNLCALVLVVPALGALPARATLLTAGSTITSNGIVLADHPELAGTTVFSESVGYFIHIPLIASRTGGTETEVGTFTTTVVREAATGNLDFYYQVVPTSGLYGPQHLALGPYDWSHLTLDADYIRSADTPPNPVDISLSNSGHGFGNIFADTSALLVRSDMSEINFHPASAEILFVDNMTGDGGSLATVTPSTIFGPGAPEPATLSLLPLAIGALALRFRVR